MEWGSGITCLTEVFPHNIFQNDNLDDPHEVRLWQTGHIFACRLLSTRGHEISVTFYITFALTNSISVHFCITIHSGMVQVFRNPTCIRRECNIFCFLSVLFTKSFFRIYSKHSIVTIQCGLDKTFCFTISLAVSYVLLISQFMSFDYIETLPSIIFSKKLRSFSFYIDQRGRFLIVDHTQNN